MSANFRPDVNYYHLLGVNIHSNIKRIKSAYHLKMLSIHPDLGGNEEQAKLLNEAYHVLSDSNLRNEYDRVRQSFFKDQRIRKRTIKQHHSTSDIIAPHPLGLKIVTVIFLIAGSTAIYWTVNNITNFFLEDFHLWNKYSLLVLSLIGFAMSLFTYTIGVGLWYGRIWAWKGSLFYSIFEIFHRFLHVLFESWSSLIWILVFLSILYYLMKPSVRKYFLSKSYIRYQFKYWEASWLQSLKDLKKL